MQTKIFGDVTPIDWQALGIKMPFAPMHQLAEKYELQQKSWDHTRYINESHAIAYIKDLNRTFESNWTYPHISLDELQYRIHHRVINTIEALNQAAPDTICINLGGGFHHAQKYPNTGYAYSLINDHIWATDYQLELYNNIRIAIWDIDFHYAGGSVEYYKNHQQVQVLSEHHPLKGVLYKHRPFKAQGLGCYALDLDTVDKVLLNLGTDYSQEDKLFGEYAWYDRAWVMAFWKNTINYILSRQKPLAVTFGGSYGDTGLSMYEELIAFLQAL